MTEPQSEIPPWSPLADRARTLGEGRAEAGPDSDRDGDRDRDTSAPDAPGRWWPLLAVVCITATAEAGVGLLLLLHLQQGFGFSVYEVASVFLPGALMFVLLPEYAHVVTDRLGRYRTMVVSLLASAGLALALTFAPGPLVIAVLWALGGDR